jgi:hypothetical protein
MPSAPLCPRCGHLDDDAFAARLRETAAVRAHHHQTRNLWLGLGAVLIVVAGALEVTGLPGARLLGALIGTVCAHRVWRSHHLGSIMLNLRPSSLTSAEQAQLYGKKAFAEESARGSADEREPTRNKNH